MTVRFSILALAVAGLVGVSALPASAGDSPDLRIAKSESGPYADHVNINLKKGDAKSVFLRAKSTSGGDEDAQLDEYSSIDAAYKVKYFKGSENITAAVRDATYPFTLKPAGTKFRAKIKAVTGAPKDCLLMRANAINSGLNGYTRVTINHDDIC